MVHYLGFLWDFLMIWKRTTHVVAKERKHVLGMKGIGKKPKFLVWGTIKVH